MAGDEDMDKVEVVEDKEVEVVEVSAEQQEADAGHDQENGDAAQGADGDPVVEVDDADAEQAQPMDCGEAQPMEEPTAAAEDSAGTGVEPEGAEGADAREEREEDVPAAEEKAKELEGDAPEDNRARLAAGSVGWNKADTTLNVMPTAGNKLLMSLSEGGFQYLLASARANVGLKAGRYMFEVKIIESLNPAEPPADKSTQGRTPQPKALVRIGVSLAGSSLFLADTCDNICFDSEGYLVHDKKRSKVAQKFGRDQIVGLLVNLDPSSPNVNTISLFKDGVRVSEPQAIPESLRGKAIYPTITYRNATIHSHFGPVPRAELPFKCRTLADAAEADVELVAEPKEQKDGQNEVVFPVGMPDQGYFDWVDQFVEKNPSYTELSDRKILEWAAKSGLWRPKAHGQSSSVSNDKPDMNFGVPLMDDLSIGRVLQAVAPTLKRNYIVPELRSNLDARDRKEALLRFGASDFRRTAIVIMGEPDQEYKDRVQRLLLEDKQAKADAEKVEKKREEERQRLIEERRKKANEARKAREAAQRKKAGEKEAAEDESKAEEKEPEKAAEDVDMKAEEDAAPLELTEEEKKSFYRKSSVGDLTERALAKSFATFSLPTKDEGFDAVNFAWQPQDKCTDFLKDWILNMKLTHPVEDLKPGEKCKERWSSWQKSLSEWRKRQSDWKDPAKKKQILAKKKGDAKNDGEEVDEEDANPAEINVEELDVFAVEDIFDIGNGDPLFLDFCYEDWTLLSIRFELHLLVHSFRQDLADPDRPSFGEAHLPIYYNKYFRKQFVLKNYSCETFAEFVELIRETLGISEGNGFLEAPLAEDTPVEMFVKHVEEHRRDRQRRIDAGDETAALKFPRPAPPQQRPAPASGGSRGSSTGSRGDTYDRGSGGARGGPRPPPPRPRDGSTNSARSSSSAALARRPSTPPPSHSSSRYGGGSGSYGRSGSRDAGSRSGPGGPPSSSRNGGSSRAVGGNTSRPGNGSSRPGYHGSGGGASGGRAPPSAPASAQKRPYPSSTASSSYPPAQRPRTSSSYGGSGGNAGGGYGSSYHRR